MSPRERTPWQAFDRPSARRLAVEGGVRVARPGAVRGAAAQRLVAAVRDRTTSGIGSRGRTYARAGQVVEVRIEDGTASAAVQGSDDAPYAVALHHERDGDVEGECSCPYGCDAVDWCKHAAALGYVVAHLVDTEPGLARAWGGPWAGRPDDVADVADVSDVSDEADGSDGSDAADAADGADAGDAADADAARAGLDRLRAALQGRAAVDAGAAWAAAVEVVPLP